jgi:endonuclease/exonuclease/phosphatase family metal-dependent hydrolase
MLSRFPIHAIKEYPLPSRLPGRGIITFCLGEKTNPLFVVNAHLSLGKKAQAKQFEFISDLIKDYQHCIVMGDFNAQPDFLMSNPSIKKSGLVLANQVGFTYPSWKPNKQIDYILVSSNIGIADAGVISSLYSDHLPVYAELILPPEIKLQALCELPEGVAP